MVLLPWRRKESKSEPIASSFADLALPLLPALYNLARWLTGDAGEAEDLVQETVLKALGGIASFDAGTNFKAWIFRILRNTYLTSRSGLAAMRTVSLEDELHHGERGFQSYPESVVNRGTPETEAIRARDADALHAAMEKLPPPMLEVLLLSDVEEMKYREIAMVVGIPIGTVMSRIARGRAFVRRELEKQSNSFRRAEK
jgi:RNA polymerase sigma-70 factor (ECF subfamily)